MKLTFTEEIEVKHLNIDIHFDLQNNKYKMTMSYTCTECAGHGCRNRYNNCMSGSIKLELNPSNLDKNLDKETAKKLRSLIEGLASEATNESR